MVPAIWHTTDYSHKRHETSMEWHVLFVDIAIVIIVFFVLICSRFFVVHIYPHGLTARARYACDHGESRTPVCRATRGFHRCSMGEGN